MKKRYEVQLEIAGSTALWTRPDTGSAPVSYPAPTFQACIGILESIAFLKSAVYIPEKVKICAPVEYRKYVTNYGGPLRKSDVIRKRASHQLFTVVLSNVCYQITARIENIPGVRKSGNSAHMLQEVYNRMLKRGSSMHVPFLGMKEFLPSYFGPFRPETKTEESINEIIPSMVFTVWDAPRNGAYSPEFAYNVRIEHGVLRYGK